jgi:hypothetical protein
MGSVQHGKLRSRSGPGAFERGEIAAVNNWSLDMQIGDIIKKILMQPSFRDVLAEIVSGSAMQTKSCLLWHVSNSNIYALFVRRKRHIENLPGIGQTQSCCKDIRKLQSISTYTQYKAFTNTTYIQIHYIKCAEPTKKHKVCIFSMLTKT